MLNLFRIFRDGKMKLPLSEYENMRGLTRESFKILEQQGFVNLFKGEFDEETGEVDPDAMLYCFLTEEGQDLYREYRVKQIGVVRSFFLNLKRMAS